MKNNPAAFFACLATAVLLPQTALLGQNPVPSSPPSLVPRNPAIGASATSASKGAAAPLDTGAPVVAPSSGAASPTTAAMASVSGDYVLSSSDTLQMTVFNEPALTTETRISADGTVQFPLIGEVKLGGMPVRDARELVRRRYNADYLVEPQVDLRVLSYATRHFTVLGQVNRPGTYDFPGGEHVSLLEAIGVAGGFTRIANEKEVEVKHAGAKSPTARVNAKTQASRDGKPFDLAPGDVITVRETWF